MPRIRIKSIRIAKSCPCLRAVEVAAGVSSGASRTPRRPRDTVSGPEFTLLGTSRIGGSYSAILRHRSGESILVRSQGNIATAIEGHAGYSVLSVGTGKLSLRYPVSVPCVEDVRQGVSCTAGPNTAELVLSSSAPLSRPATSATFEQQAGSTESSTAQGINPFEGIIAAQRPMAMILPKMVAAVVSGLSLNESARKMSPPVCAWLLPPSVTGWLNNS